MAGVRTRAKTLAMAVAEEKARSGRGRRRRKKEKKNLSEAAAELRVSHLQLRSRRVVMKPPLPLPPRVKPRSAANSNRRPRRSLDPDRTVPCSITASYGVDREEEDTSQLGEFDPSRVCCVRSGGGRNETTISSIRTNGSAAEAEIEEFFMAAERAERSRFAVKYNYDIFEDVPLEGRYEWGVKQPLCSKSLSG